MKVDKDHSMLNNFCLSEHLEWNCVNLLVFCGWNKWRWCHQTVWWVTSSGCLSLVSFVLPFDSVLLSALPLVWMVQTRWHREHDTVCHKHVTTCHEAWHVINMTCNMLLIWPIIKCGDILMWCEHVISSAGLIRAQLQVFWWMILDWRLNGNHESHEVVRWLLSWFYWAAISQESWSVDQWQIWIVSAHHNQWQDEMIQITSWNCEMIFLFWDKRFYNDSDSLNAF